MSITKILSIAVIAVIAFAVGTNAIQFSVSCGTFNTHSQPDSFSSVVGTVSDTIDVVCQTTGSDAIADLSPGASYLIWDKLKDGSFISDLFVVTNGCGFDNTIPRC